MFRYKNILTVFFLSCAIFLLQYLFSLPLPVFAEQSCSTGGSCHLVYLQHNCAFHNLESECVYSTAPNGQACIKKTVDTYESVNDCTPEACIGAICVASVTVAGSVEDTNNPTGNPEIPISIDGTEVGTGGPFSYTHSLLPTDRTLPTFTVSIALPSNYIAVGPTSQTVQTQVGTTNVTFQVEQVYSISGNVFVDSNKNGVEDTGESNYQTTPSISITPTGGTVTTNPDGSYAITNLLPGTYTVTYGSLPTGYYMTSPLTGTPISFSVTVGTTGCSVNGAPGASCTNGSISNLNFGISNTYPWFQSTCGDMRNDNGFVDNLPTGTSPIITASGCTTAGLVFTGNINAILGNGQASQIVGGATYPEVYPSNYSPLSTSYPSLLSKATNAGITPVDVTGNPVNCNLSSCTLPSTLTHGIYSANGSLTLNGFAAPAGQNFVFLVNGNLTINGPVTVPVGSTVLFSVNGNITVSPTVGETIPTSVSSDLAGWYVAGGSFILPSSGNCTDLRLNIAGSVVVNALGSGGTFQNNRDLCGSDTTDPTVLFSQRLDMILNAPQFLQTQQILSQEVSP